MPQSSDLINWSLDIRGGSRVGNWVSGGGRGSGGDRPV